MNLAQELYLCAVDGSGYAFSHRLPPGIGGALASELALAGRIRVDEKSIELLDSTPTGDDIVDEALGDLQHPNAPTWGPIWWVSRVGRASSERVRERVVADGLATLEPGGRSWMYFVRKPDRLKLTPAGEEPRRRLQAVLLGRQQPDPRTAVLGTLASVCKLIRHHVPRSERKAAEERAAAFSAGDAVPEGVREAIKGAENATASATLGAQSAIHN